ncbi:hypothetical protein, partial [Terribacillus saccharophilus]
TYIDNPFQYIIAFKKDSGFHIENIELVESDLYEHYHEYEIESDFIEFALEKELSLKKEDIIFKRGIALYEEDLQYNNSEKIMHSIKVQHESFYDNMKTLIRGEAQHYKKHISYQASYYAKNAHKYAYSVLDLDPMIKKVNDEDFEYQLNEAIAAYDHSLYMASTACLGVSLETLCKILLEKNGKVISEYDSTILSKLADRLYRDNIISKRFKSRLDICYKLRNLSAHTSPGVVIREDCHTIISTINEFVNTYFD